MKNLVEENSNNFVESSLFLDESVSLIREGFYSAQDQESLKKLISKARTEVSKNYVLEIAKALKEKDLLSCPLKSALEDAFHEYYTKAKPAGHVVDMGLTLEKLEFLDVIKGAEKKLGCNSNVNCLSIAKAF